MKYNLSVLGYIPALGTLLHAITLSLPHNYVVCQRRANMPKKKAPLAQKGVEVK